MTTGQLMFIGLAGGIGGVCATLGVQILITNLRLLRDGVRTEATVAGYEKRVSMDEDDSGRRSTVTFLHPILEFKDSGGREQRVVLDEGSSSKPYAESYPVRIIYARDNPNTVCIDTFLGMWMWVTILLGIGSVLLAAALLIWWYDVPVKMN